MTVKLRLLKAAFGDAFIFEISNDKETFILMVDSGPNIASCKIVPQIINLSKIDLLVLSHYDADHIQGFINYFKENKEDSLKIKEYWCNCSYQIKLLEGTNLSAYDDAKSFADYLHQFSNEGKSIQWTEKIVAGHKLCNDFVEIEVVAPKEKSLDNNIKAYQKHIDTKLSKERVNSDLETPLDKLAKRKTIKNSQIINNASIAFILRANNKSFLMLGDVQPHDVYDYLIEQGFSKDKPLKIDYIKVAHHGSRYNIDVDLLDIIQCNNYIISTNGGYAGTKHPDRETIAKILYHSRRDKNKKINLYFNYSLKDLADSNSIFLKEGEDKLANFEIHENVEEL